MRGFTFYGDEVFKTSRSTRILIGKARKNIKPLLFLKTGFLPPMRYTLYMARAFSRLQLSQFSHFLLMFSVLYAH